jgi:hypothetical protein
MPLILFNLGCLHPIARVRSGDVGFLFISFIMNTWERYHIHNIYKENLHINDTHNPIFIVIIDHYKNSNAPPQLPTMSLTCQHNQPPYVTPSPSQTTQPRLDTDTQRHRAHNNSTSKPGHTIALQGKKNQTTHKIVENTT